MNDLNINYKETKAVGNNVTVKGEDFQELLNRIKSVNEQLKTYWQGSDASKYSSAVDTQLVEMQQLSNVIKEIGEFLVKTGNSYEEAMQTNMSGVDI